MHVIVIELFCVMITFIDIILICLSKLHNYIIFSFFKISILTILVNHLIAKKWPFGEKGGSLIEPY